MYNFFFSSFNCLYFQKKSLVLFYIQKIFLLFMLSHKDQSLVNWL